jgi:hypothetical protein
MTVLLAGRSEQTKCVNLRSVDGLGELAGAPGAVATPLTKRLLKAYDGVRA